MQVSHVQDHITHAVMGPNTAQSFGISESAEFFNILSNTLYSDKILAVVREVLCNAWDAHIVSGRTDTPVEVTLTNQHLIIKDRGTGIKKALMHSVYCVYGASTKLNDGFQTGGFGLGCKAPFAYTDHFEVTDCCDGEKTIYQISKSSGEVGGKPGLVPIITLPTDETGIQVKIDIKHRDDVDKFGEVIRRIVAAGEMRVSFNGQLLETLPFSEAKEGYLITKQQVAAEGTKHQIFVRYGNVVYPIEVQEKFHDVYQEAVSLLTKLPGYDHWNKNNWRLILQAKPHSISVTPSRESLSMTDHTIETLRQLLTEFISTRNRRVDIETQKINEVGVAQTFLNLDPTAVLDTHRKIVGLSYDSYDGHTVLTDFGTISRAIASRHYPSSANFRKKDVELRLRSLIDSGYGNRGKIQAYLADYLNKRRTGRPHSDWFSRRIVAPLIVAMKSNKDIIPARLLVYGKNEAPSERQRRMSYAEQTFSEATRFKKSSFEDYLPFLRNLVILTYNRSDVEERAGHFPEMKHWFGSPSDSLVYVVHRSEPKVEAAKAFFTKQGFTILDLTRRYKGEALPQRAKEIREYKARPKGIPVLSCLLPDGAKKISTDWAKVDGVERIENPEFIVKIAARNDFAHFERFSIQGSIDIVRLFGSKGGIVVNETQGDKYKLLGAVPATEWIFDKVIAEIKSNVRIQKYLSVDRNRMDDGPSRLDYQQREVLEAILEDDVLRTYYDLGHDMTEDDARYLRLWRELAQQLRWSREKEVKVFNTYLESFPLSENMKTVAAAIKSSALVGMISLSQFGRILRGTEKSPKSEMQKARARDILICTISG